MENCLAAYTSALKLEVRLDKDEIEDEAGPSFTNWEGNWWALGVKIVRKVIPGVRWWGTYCILAFEFGEPGLYCFIEEWFSPRKIAEDLFQKFHRLNQKVLHEGKEVWIPQSLKVEEVATFEESLEGVVEQWIELWKKVGGMKEVIKGGE